MAKAEINKAFRNEEKEEGALLDDSADNALAGRGSASSRNPKSVGTAVGGGDNAGGRGAGGTPNESVRRRTAEAQMGFSRSVAFADYEELFVALEANMPAKRHRSWFKEIVEVLVRSGSICFQALNVLGLIKYQLIKFYTFLSLIRLGIVPRS
jgi:hypothetical protein